MECMERLGNPDNTQTRLHTEDLRNRHRMQLIHFEATTHLHQNNQSKNCYTKSWNIRQRTSNLHHPTGLVHHTCIQFPFPTTVIPDMQPEYIQPELLWTHTLSSLDKTLDLLVCMHRLMQLILISRSNQSLTTPLIKPIPL